MLPTVLLWVLALLPALPLAVIRIAGWVGDSNRMDWLSYVRGAQLLFAGESPYAAFQISRPYTFAEAAGGAGYVYPPSAAVVMAPVLQPFELWVAVSTIVWFGGLIAVVWVHGATPLRVAAAIWLGLFAPGFRDGILGGSVSPLLAGGLGLIYAGVPAAGLLVAIKGFPLPWVVLDLRGRSLAVTAVGLGVPLVIAIVLGGIEPWGDFISAFANARPVCGTEFQSLPCAGFPTVLGLAIAALVFAVATRLPRPWTLFALGFIPLVISPNIWWHYSLMIVPGSIAIVLDGRRGSSTLSRLSSPRSAAAVDG